MYFAPPSLVDRLIDEVTEMPGALPLLSFTLRELFLKYLRSAATRTNRAITEADYEELGGIKQALVNRAEAEYHALTNVDPAFATTIRHVMLRLVATSGTGNTRRQVPLSELDYAEPEGARVQQMLTQFKAARLLVGDTTADEQPYVEPAHDALVEGWPRLLQWLETGSQADGLDGSPRKGGLPWQSQRQDNALDEREKLLLQRRLTPAAIDWQREQKAPFLWHADARLHLLKQIRQQEPHWFNTTEAEFVQRSLGRKRFNVGLRWVSIFGLLAVSIAVSIFVEEQRQQAVIAQQQAEDRRIDTEKRNAQILLSSSRDNLQNDQHLDALLEALEAARIVQANARVQEDSKLVAQATLTLQQAVYENRETMRLPSLNWAALSPQGTYIATIDENNIKAWSNSLNRFVLDEEHGLSNIGANRALDYEIDLKFSADEKTLLLTEINNPSPKAWRTDGGLFEPSSPEVSIQEILSGQDSIYIQHEDRLVNYEAERDQDSACHGNSGRPIHPKFSPQKNLVVFSCADGSIKLREIERAEVEIRLPIFSINSGSAFSHVSTASAGSDMVVSNDGLAKLWALSKSDNQKPDLVALEEEEVIAFDLSGDGEKIAALDAAGSIFLWTKDALTAKKIAEVVSKDRIEARASEYLPFAEQRTPVPLALVHFSAQGDFLAVSSGSVVHLFDGDGNLIENIEHDSEITGLDFHPNDSIVVSSSRDGSLNVWSLKAETVENLSSLDIGGFLTTARFNWDGSQIAVAYSDSFSGDIDQIGATSDQASDSTIAIFDLDLDKLQRVAAFPKLDAPYLTKLDFLSDNQIVFSGLKLQRPFQFFRPGDGYPGFVGTGVGLLNLDGGSIRSIRASDSPNFQQISIHPSEAIVAVDISKILEGGDSVNLPSLWNLDGEILADERYFTLFRDGYFESNPQDFPSYLWTFSRSGNAIATLQGDGRSIALWSFDLNDLANRSCELLSNYLSGPLATEDEKSLCHGNINQSSLTTLRPDLGGYRSSLGGYSPVIQEGLVVGMGFNQSWLQVEHGRK